jgi:hypothetical protein
LIQFSRTLNKKSTHLVYIIIFHMTEFTESTFLLSLAFGLFHTPHLASSQNVSALKEICRVCSSMLFGGIPEMTKNANGPNVSNCGRRIFYLEMSAFEVISQQ